MADRKEKKLIVVIPEELHSQLKIYSALTDKSIKDIVIESLRTTIEPFSDILKKSKVDMKQVLTATIQPPSSSQEKPKKI